MGRKSRASACEPVFTHLEDLFFHDGHVFWEVSGPGGKLRGKFTARLTYKITCAAGSLFFTGKSPVVPIEPGEKRKNG